MANQNTSTSRKYLFFILNLLYDVFSVVINLTDMASDIVICIQFGFDENWVFFGLCVTLIVIGQLCYSFLFIVLFVPGDIEDDFWFLLIVFVFIFPFAQFVPFFIWLTSFNFECVDSFLNCVGLNERDKPYFDETKDPLKNYIEKKFQTHGGFIIEAMVESVPQSIVQMIAIVITGNVYWLSVVSIIISIISVASKGFMLSYCIDRATAAFNFTCFVTDTFNVFCIVSWIFFSSGVAGNYQVFFLVHPIDDFATQIWLYKEFVICCAAFSVGITIYMGWIVLGLDAARNGTCTQRIQGFFAFVIIGIMGCLLFGPAMIVMEGVSLALIPVVAFKSLSSDDAGDHDVLFNFYSWLKRGNFSTKILIANRFFALQYLKSTFKTGLPNNYNQIIENHLKKAPLDRISNYETPMACAIVSSTEKDLTLGEIQKYTGIRLRDFFEAYINIVEEEASTMERSPNPLFIMKIALRLGAYIYIPLLTLSAIYNLIYPIISFCIVPFAQIGILQKILSIMYFFCLFVLLVLAYPVHQYQKIKTYLFTFHRVPTAANVSKIKKNYVERRLKRVRDNVIRISLLIANGRYNAENTTSDAIVSILPTIEQFIGMKAEHSINVSSFLETVFYKDQIIRSFESLYQEENLSSINLKPIGSSTINIEEDKKYTKNNGNKTDQSKNIDNNQPTNREKEAKKRALKLVRSFSAPQHKCTSSAPLIAGVIPQPHILGTVGQMMTEGVMTWKHTALLRSISEQQKLSDDTNLSLHTSKRSLNNPKGDDMFSLPSNNPLLNSSLSAPI